jgi:hypothetical protein
MKTIKQSLISRGLVVMLSIGASGFALSANAESSTKTKPPTTDTSKLKVGDVSPDGNYVFKGQAIGWELMPHTKAMKDGKLIHTDKLSHDAKPPVTKATKIGDYSPDGIYIYKGGSVGWELAPHKKVLKNGKWVHTDKIPKDSPAPPAPTAKEIEQNKLESPGG